MSALMARKLRYDWATGSRWWGDHEHPKHPDEPISYAGWFEWAKKHGKKHRNVPCPTPGCPILTWDDQFASLPSSSWSVAGDSGMSDCEAIGCDQPATTAVGNIIDSTRDELQLCDRHAAVAEAFGCERFPPDNAPVEAP